MKAVTKKSAAPVKAAAKTGLKSKATAKPVAKPAAKPVAKPVTKAGKSKTAVKPAVKVAAKPVGVKKPAAKVAPKVAVKAGKVVKPATSKSKTMPKAVKPVAKPAVKPVLKADSEKSASASKVKPKSTPGTTIKPTAKLPAKPPLAIVIPAKAGKAPVAPIASKLAPTPSPVPRPVEKSMLIPIPPALKPGRRSSTRAPSHLPPPAPMVPTHAPDAAKASYSTMTERVIAPPPHVAAKKDPKLANNWKTTAADQLTDDEVKAMPDAEYMNDKQMAFFRHKLSILKQDIHNSAGETTEHLREDTVVVPDPADRATIEEEHALELRTRDRERKLLKKIEQSIARIDSGDYGYCDETGEPIGVGRLIARPTANLSLEAQQRRELKQKMFGD